MVTDTKVPLFKDHFWHFQIKIKFRKKIKRQDSVRLPDVNFFWIIPWYLATSIKKKKKKKSQLVETLMFICMQKMIFLPNFFFWDIVKILQTYYFEYFENAWSYPEVMVVSPCRHLWCLKCWNRPVGDFDVYLLAKNQLPS